MDQPCRTEPGPSRIAFVLVPRFNMMTLTGLIEPMRIANYLAPAPLYEWHCLSTDAPRVVASNGMAADCAALPANARGFARVFVLGSWGCERAVSAGLIGWVRRAHRDGAALAAVELGCYVLARAGLLDGRAATTHWSCLAGFHEQFPDVALSEQLYTVDGKIITCAGGTAGMDLMLHLIAERHGPRLAGEISDQVLHHPVRPAGDPQRKTLGRGMETLAPEVRHAIRLMESNILEPLRVPQIAARVGLSQRQLERQFKMSMGCSVVQFGQLLRLQHARVLLVSTSLSIREVAVASGFNTMSHFAHAFRNCFGKRPSQYRQMWPEQDPVPSWPGTLLTFVESLRTAGPRRRRSG